MKSPPILTSLIACATVIKEGDIVKIQRGGKLTFGRVEFIDYKKRYLRVRFGNSSEGMGFEGFENRVKQVVTIYELLAEVNKRNH